LGKAKAEIAGKIEPMIVSRVINLQVAALSQPWSHKAS
jgi:hypothetical protein